MKKLLFSLVMVLALTAVVSCNKNKDDNDPTNPSNPGNNGIYTEHLDEGIYQPMMHISTITTDGAVSQEWTWDGNNLQHVANRTNNTISTFTYNGDLLASVNTSSVETNKFIYSGGKLQAVRLLSLGNMLMLRKNMIHTGEHITGVTYDSVSQAYILSLLASYMMKGKQPSKFSIGEVSASGTYTWTGNNITHETLEGTATAGVSMQEISYLVDFGELIRNVSYGGFNLGSMLSDEQIATIVSYLQNDATETPIDLTASIASDYTYDSKRNPMQYYWGADVTAASLSANNPLSVNKTTTISAVIHYTVPSDMPVISTLPIIGQLLVGTTLDLPYTLDPIEENDNFSYQYNSNDFPTTVGSNITGHVTTYQY